MGSLADTCESRSVKYKVTCAAPQFRIFEKVWSLEYHACVSTTVTCAMSRAGGF